MQEHHQTQAAGQGTDRPVLSQAVLNIAEKKRTSLFPWRGQFSPQLVEVHIRAYAAPGMVILDPFAGSGTVLVEAARRGLRGLGAEINPAAAIMARTFELVTVKRAERARLLAGVDATLAALARPDKPTDLQTPLLALRAHMAPGSAARHLVETLIVLLDYQRRPVDAPRLRATWDRLQALVRGLPESNEPVMVALADARDLPLCTGSVDLIITSPPYINVFNYHQQYRASVEALQWNVLPIARSEIGANRKHRNNRFLTVIQYCLDMVLALVELSRICRPGARAVFVVGRESRVRKTAFANGRILEQLAEKCAGLSVVLRQERWFHNRFGQRIAEDLLHVRMHPVAGTEHLIQAARSTAVDVLDRARHRAPQESLRDLDDAIRRADAIEPSPMFRASGQAEELIRGFSRLRNGAQ